MPRPTAPPESCCECASITFDAARPLTGTGLVCIDANVTMPNGNNTLFNGLLYIKGSFSMRAPSEINGAVVLEGNMTLQGSGGNYAIINYNKSILEALRLVIGNYRLSGALRPVLDRENL